MYALVYSPCASCGKAFGYNPHRVPSIRIDGVRQPVCKDCIEAENLKRQINIDIGQTDPDMPLLTYHPDAYEPIPEEEM